MKKFDSVRAAIEWLDVSGTHGKIKNCGGVAALTMAGDQLHDAEAYASNLLAFIETGDLKRELEAQFAEGGVIDLTVPGDESLDGDYFAEVDTLKRLHASWQARKARRNNVVEMKPLSH